MHGGEDFDILVARDNQVLLCLHKWGEHQHPSMSSPDITPGNGLILYFRTESLEEIRQNATNLGCTIEQELHLNTNSTKMEFSLRDPDGYYLTVTEFHQYQG